MPDYPSKAIKLDKEGEKMTIEEVKPFLEKDIKFYLKDGRFFEGYLFGVIPFCDAPSGKNSLDVFIDHYYMAVPIDDVDRIVESGK